MKLRGTAGEEVEIGFVTPEGMPYSVTCLFQKEANHNNDSSFSGCRRRHHNGAYPNYHSINNDEYKHNSAPQEEHLTLTLLSSGFCFC